MHNAKSACKIDPGLTMAELLKIVSPDFLVVETTPTLVVVTSPTLVVVTTHHN